MAAVKSVQLENNFFMLNHILIDVDLNLYHWDFRNLSCF